MGPVLETFFPVKNWLHSALFFLTALLLTFLGKITELLNKQFWNCFFKRTCSNISLWWGNIHQRVFFFPFRTFSSKQLHLTKNTFWFGSLFSVVWNYYSLFVFNMWKPLFMDPLNQKIAKLASIQQWKKLYSDFKKNYNHFWISERVCVHKSVSFTTYHFWGNIQLNIRSSLV